MEQDIDLAVHGNLEEYAKSGLFPVDVLEAWVSAGLLSPKETAGAQKLLRMLRTKNRSENSQ